MAFNGTGTFVRLYNWVADLGNSIPVTASRMDAEQDGIATGLSNCITKDGQTTITANIPMNSKKFTGLTDGSARTDSIALGQVQDNTYGNLGTSSGTDTYTAAPSPAITAYVASQRFTLQIGTTNTGAATLNINGVSAGALEKYDGAGALTALVAGDLIGGQKYDIVRDQANTKFIVLNPQNNTAVSAVPAASETVAGVAEIATDAEAAAATSDTTIITPLKQRIAQVVNYQTGAVATGTTLIPFDDTIPQITEGNEYMTLAITPTSATNKLEIKVSATVMSTAAGWYTAALFQDATTNALAANYTWYDAGSTGGMVSFIHYMTTGTTSSTTFRIRAGCHQAGTMTFNGSAGARRMGGVNSSSITITEIKA